MLGHELRKNGFEDSYDLHRALRGGTLVCCRGILGLHQPTPLGHRQTRYKGFVQRQTSSAESAIHFGMTASRRVESRFQRLLTIR